MYHYNSETLKKDQKHAKKNENYTEKQVREISLAHTNGEIINVKKEFELEDDKLAQSTFEYEVEIKTPENLLNILKVSARTGTIEINNEDLKKLTNKISCI